MHKIRIVATMLVMPLPSAAAGAAATSYAGLERRIDAVVTRGRSPSIVAAIFDDRHILWSHVAGYSDLKSKTVPSLRTRYRLGSMAKAMTSTVLAIAAQRRLSSFDEKVAVQTTTGTMLSSLGRLVNMQEGLAQAVCYQGITGDTDPDCDRAFDNRFSVSMTAGEGRYSYSNMGPQRAADALAARLRKPFDEIALNLLFAPNRMVDATFDHRQSSRSRATSYDRDSKQFDHDFSILPRAGAGLEASANDLVHFGQLHLTGRAANGRRLLSPRALTLLHAAPNGGFYGYGWGRIGAGTDTEVLISDGQVNGGQAMLLINETRQLGAVVISNAATDDVSELALSALDTVVPGTSAAFSANVETEQRAHEVHVAAFLPPEDFNGTGVLLAYGRTLKVEVSSRGNHLTAIIGGTESAAAQSEQDEGFRGWIISCPDELAACRRPHATAKLWLSRDGKNLGGQLQVTSYNGQLPFAVRIALR